MGVVRVVKAPLIMVVFMVVRARRVQVLVDTTVLSVDSTVEPVELVESVESVELVELSELALDFTVVKELRVFVVNLIWKTCFSKKEETKAKRKKKKKKKKKIVVLLRDEVN